MHISAISHIIKAVISKELQKAREYENKAGALVTEAERPAFHLSPRIGWLNDPNGFSFYGSKYHLFYQYHPYNSFWGPMHWGHAESSDLVSWEYLPCALAPDEDYDVTGCFSGSAATLTDGRRLLMYTGVCDDGKDPLKLGRWRQSQCVAVSDGAEFIKYEGNPVIMESDLPEGGDPYEFRDPFIRKNSDSSFMAIVANGSDPEKGTRLLKYRSENGFDWSYDGELFEDEDKIGIMWECPNFFPLGEKWVLIASPMDMEAEAEEAEGTVRFPKGNNVCYIVGDYDEASGEFIPDKDKSGKTIYHPVDLGLDFYAPQVTETPDGRTVMIAWMQDPKPAMLHDENLRIFGQMSIARELSLVDGRLVQQPVRELNHYKDGCVLSKSFDLKDEKIELDEACGRVLDLDIEIHPITGDGGGVSSYSDFSVCFAESEATGIKISYDPHLSVITIDRSAAGYDSHAKDIRRIKTGMRGGHLSLRLLIDRWSAELFINGGEQTSSLTYYTPVDADGLSLSVKGRVLVDVTVSSISFDRTNGRYIVKSK